jgi:hypothetical protein
MVLKKIELEKATWTELGSILTPKRVPKGSQIDPSSVQVAYSNSIFFKTMMFTKTFQKKWAFRLPCIKMENYGQRLRATLMKIPPLQLLHHLP